MTKILTETFDNIPLSVINFIGGHQYGRIDFIVRVVDSWTSDNEIDETSSYLTGYLKGDGHMEINCEHTFIDGVQGLLRHLDIMSNIFNVCKGQIKKNGYWLEQN